MTAVAYDNPIPGFKTNNTINLRLWAAKPDREFDLEAFNTGDYVQVGTFRKSMSHTELYVLGLFSKEAQSSISHDHVLATHTAIFSVRRDENSLDEDLRS